MHELVHRDLAWIPNAPIVVEETVEIDAPPAQVFRHVADHEGWTAWFKGLNKVEVTGAATGVGGQRRVTVGKIVIDEEFIGWEDDRLFAFTLTAISRHLVSSMAESVRVEPLANDRSRVTYTMGLEPRPRWGAFTRLATRSLRRNLQRALGRLAEISTSGSR